ETLSHANNPHLMYEPFRKKVSVANACVEIHGGQVKTLLYFRAFTCLALATFRNKPSNKIPVYSSSASAISHITLKILAKISGGSSGILSGDSFRIRLATLITEKCYSSANPRM